MVLPVNLAPAALPEAEDCWRSSWPMAELEEAQDC